MPIQTPFLRLLIHRLGVKLFDTEVNRKIKKEPALAIDIDRPVLAFPGKLDGLSAGSVEGGEDDPVHLGVDVVSELWTF